MSFTSKEIDDIIKKFQDVMTCIKSNCTPTNEQVINIYKIEQELKEKCSKYKDFKKRIKCYNSPEVKADKERVKKCLNKHCKTKYDNMTKLEDKYYKILSDAFTKSHECAENLCSELIEKRDQINQDCNKKHKKDYMKVYNCKKDNPEYKKINKALDKCKKTNCKSVIEHEKLSKLLEKYNKVVIKSIEESNKRKKKIIAKYEKSTKKYNKKTSMNTNNKTINKIKKTNKTKKKQK